MSAASACFHCGEPLRGSSLSVAIDGHSQPVCCNGCLAVAELIAGAGLIDFYRYRKSPAARPDEAALEPDIWAGYAMAEVASQFVQRTGETDSVTLLVDGLRCSACSWLVEQVLRSTEGVREATANAATGRAHVAWDRSRLDLADIMRAVAQLGYPPHALNDASLIQLQQQEQRAALKRLAVAGFGMMQVMMFAVSVYAAEIAGEVMDAGLLALFRVASLLVATPVMFYAGAPVFAGAWNSLRLRTVGMDVPVSAALVLAYVASVWNTFRGSGEVYFDSVTMFVFFLTLGRFVQMSVRHRTTGVTDALARQLPAFAHKWDQGSVRDVPVSALARGDVVLVRTGEILPVDGELMDAEAHLDEAMLTGESKPVRRHAGERLSAGTLNVQDPIRLRATDIAAGTVLSHVVSLLRRAQAQKPAMSKAADAAAARFLRYVLWGAGLTCSAWLVVDPARAFEATLAVLVVACPCAFAIATPAALSAATAQLARQGLLVTRPDTLEALARIDAVVFDKTGTLTSADLRLTGCRTLADQDEHRCRQIAAALELASEHPLARAFAQAEPLEPACDVRTVAGSGVEGIVRGRRYRIGTPQFVAQLRGAASPAASGENSGTSGAGNAVEAGQAAAASDAPGDGDRCRRPPAAATGPGGQDRRASHAEDFLGTEVSLGDETRELAVFELRDVLRSDAAATVAMLRGMGISSRILSGDSHDAVAAIAARCGIAEFSARCSPAHKLAEVQAMQATGRRVAMIGDGVNDAPVLAAADVSIAMGRGAALAQVGADMLLMNDRIQAVPEAVALARRTLRIARQNLVWAAGYNLGSLPLAALGFIPPWLAALGMSISSVGVVLNALRLLPRRADRPGNPGFRLRPLPASPAAAQPSQVA